MPGKWNVRRKITQGVAQQRLHRVANTPTMPVFHESLASLQAQLTVLSKMVGRCGSHAD